LSFPIEQRSAERQVVSSESGVGGHAYLLAAAHQHDIVERDRPDRYDLDRTSSAARRGRAVSLAPGVVGGADGSGSSMRLFDTVTVAS
jgi:hypothetical protein